MRRLKRNSCTGVSSRTRPPNKPEATYLEMLLHRIKKLRDGALTSLARAMWVPLDTCHLAVWAGWRCWNTLFYLAFLDELALQHTGNIRTLNPAISLYVPDAWH